MIKAEYSDDFKDLYNNAGTFICHSDEGFGWGGLSMIYGTNPGNNNHVVIISNDDEDDDYYYVANGKKINTKDFGGTFYNYVANVYLDEDNQKLKIYDDNFELSKEIECAYGYELLYGEEDKTYSIYDMISKKVLYEFEGDNCIMGDSVPYIKMDKKYYDFNGKLIVDLEELNKK